MGMRQCMWLDDTLIPTLTRKLSIGSVFYDNRDAKTHSGKPCRRLLIEVTASPDSLSRTISSTLKLCSMIVKRAREDEDEEMSEEPPVRKRVNIRQVVQEIKVRELASDFKC